MNVPPAVQSVSGKKILIIGNLNIDIIIRNVPAIPVWGQEVLGSDYRICSSGQSAYTASALSRLDVDTGIISCVGDDDYGRLILDELAERRIDITAVRRIRDGKTGIAIAMVRDDGERAFVSDPGSLGSFDRTMAAAGLDEKTGFFVTCILGNFFLPGLTLDDVRVLLERSRTSHSLTLLDTGWDPGGWSPTTVRGLRDLFRHVDFFMPNMDEARAITGESHPEKAAGRLLSDGCGTVIIKLGDRGSYLRTAEAEIHVPAVGTRVHDAVGAGDVYNAGFIFGTLQDWPLETRMTFGASLASIYISRRSDRFPHLESVLRLMKGIPEESAVEEQNENDR